VLCDGWNLILSKSAGNFRFGQSLVLNMIVLYCCFFNGAYWIEDEVGPRIGLNLLQKTQLIKICEFNEFESSSWEIREECGLSVTVNSFSASLFRHTRRRSENKLLNLKCRRSFWVHSRPVSTTCQSGCPFWSKRGNYYSVHTARRHELPSR
jgi:hypothetical protein